ncbi:MAG: hypothetical protein DRR16_08435 [Candidatus Parabeggiatoa sp. nov. 3]|nr:MAG: hypothetical protein DRR00_26170 [Gammaproteobacteria bacterium]RKZ86952.1 MAG: hypothetical protein DRR16_08435 [Gammaproteobacteria bacterium]
MEEKTFLQKLNTLGAIVGIITAIGAAAFACYKTCYSDKECPFLEMDSLQFDVYHRYRSPCEENFIPLQNRNTLYSEGDYKMEFIPQKKEDWLTAHLPNKENKYVYIFQIDNGKRIYRLIPIEHSVNQEEQSTPFVRVDTSYSLPVKQIDKNTGRTKIYFLSFNAPNDQLDELYEDIQKNPQGTAKHDNSRTKLIDAVQSAWQEKEDSWLTTSVPVMTFKYDEKPSCGHKESEHKESELHVEVKYSYRSEGESDFKPLHDNAVLYSGDQYKIQFRASEDSYVYVFHMFTDNQQHKDYTLFPCTVDVRIGQNPVSANTTYYLPNEKRHWILEEQLGFEKIYFLAFKTNHDLKPEYQQIDQACKQQDSDNWVFKSLNLQDKGVFSNTLTFKHQ